MPVFESALGAVLRAAHDTHHLNESSSDLLLFWSSATLLVLRNATL